MGSTKKTVAKKAAANVTKNIKDEVPEGSNPSAPTPVAPPQVTNRLIDMAIEAGLPELDEDGSEEYKALWETYVRFIRQSPEKWELEKEALLDKLDRALHSRQS